MIREQTHPGTASLWPPDSARRRIHSALGISVAIPEAWQAIAEAGKILAAPRNHLAPFAPLQIVTTAASERSLRQTERRFSAALRQIGARICDRQLLTQPREALLVDYEKRLPEGIVRCRNICELLDDGQLMLSFTLSDWSAAGLTGIETAVDIWRSTRIDAPPIPRHFRRLVHEEGRLQLAVPERWLLDLFEGGLIALRQPDRPRSNPTVTIQIDYTAHRTRALSELAAQLNRSPQGTRHTAIGNRYGFRVDFERHDGHGRPELIRELVPEPLPHAVFYIQLCAAPEHAHLLDKVQSTFYWRDAATS